VEVVFVTAAGLDVSAYVYVSVVLATLWAAWTRVAMDPAGEYVQVFSYAEVPMSQLESEGALVEQLADPAAPLWVQAADRRLNSS
jgi:hypothetical protein